MTATIHDDLSRATIKLLLQEPFYGHVLAGLIKEVSGRAATTGLSRDDSAQMVRLVINPRHWDDLGTLELRLGAIKHEVLHLIFKHILRAEAFLHRRLFWIAADLVVNQYLSPEQLPPDAVTLQRLSSIPLEPLQGVDYYYKALLDHLQQTDAAAAEQEAPSLPSEDAGAPGGGEAVGGGDPEGGVGSKSQAVAVTYGAKGQVAVAAGAAEEGGEGAAAPQGDALSRLLASARLALDDHGLWEDFARMPRAEQRIVDQILDGVIQQSVRRIKSDQFGALPASLRRYLDDLMEALAPRLDWRRALRLFAESSRRTWLKNTVRRPSKRYGTTPGVKVRRRQKILAVVDTSGSVVEGELRRFFSEVHHIWSRGAEVVVVECDCAIHAITPYRGRLPSLVSGGGGTLFDPPILFANEVYRPDGVIYFTDGYAPEPQVLSRCPILWLISERGIPDEDPRWQTLQGRKLRIAL